MNTIAETHLANKVNAARQFFSWDGRPQDLVFDAIQLRASLLRFDQPVFAVRMDDQVGFTNQGHPLPGGEGMAALVGWLPPLSIAQFGDPAFSATYGVKAAYYAGAMANAIASEEMVIALGKAGLMGSFGSGGLSTQRVQAAIEAIQAALPEGPYMFNLLHNPFEPEIEQQTVDLYLRHAVRTVEAAAFVRLTPAVVQFRASGLARAADGEIQIKNRVIAKISRREIAQLFLSPAPANILQKLSAESRITVEQSRLAALVPMADDITVEADSGGHTDNQPLVALLPSILAQRNHLQAEFRFPQAVRIGAAGGISTPESALAAYMMGAAYVVTGSINQACVESGASQRTRQMLSQSAMADVTMAPSADMFELGARVQVLKKGTLFPMRAQKLYDLYTTYDSIDDIPADIHRELEDKIFRRPLGIIWQETTDFFKQRNPEQITKAERNPKKKMALIFRWYLGLSSRWARDGVDDRKMDYQVWCGPSMGAFNEWAQGTYLEDSDNRHVEDVAWQLLNGCLYRYRVHALKTQGVPIPHESEAYIPISAKDLT